MDTAGKCEGLRIKVNRHPRISRGAPPQNIGIPDPVLCYQRLAKEELRLRMRAIL